jgi:uncharacterized protein
MLITNQAVNNDISYSSTIIEHIVPKTKAPAFQQWLQNLICHAQQFEGFVNAHLPPPLVYKNDALKWHLVMYFDSPTHLNAWLTARDRKELMKSGQPFLNLSIQISYNWLRGLVLAPSWNRII